MENSDEIGVNNLAPSLDTTYLVRVGMNELFAEIFDYVRCQHDHNLYSQHLQLFFQPLLTFYDVLTN